MYRLRNIAMCDYQESVTTKKAWLLDRRTDRRQTKWSLCAAMLRRRHKNNFSTVFLAIVIVKFLKLATSARTLVCMAPISFHRVKFDLKPWPLWILSAIMYLILHTCLYQKKKTIEKMSEHTHTCIYTLLHELTIFVSAVLAKNMCIVATTKYVPANLCNTPGIRKCGRYTSERKYLDTYNMCIKTRPDMRLANVRHGSDMLIFLEMLQH